MTNTYSYKIHDQHVLSSHNGNKTLFLRRWERFRKYTSDKALLKKKLFKTQ